MQNDSRTRHDRLASEVALGMRKAVSAAEGARDIASASTSNLVAVQAALQARRPGAGTGSAPSEADDRYEVRRDIIRINVGSRELVTLDEAAAALRDALYKSGSQATFEIVGPAVGSHFTAQFENPLQAGKAVGLLMEYTFRRGNRDPEQFLVQREGQSAARLFFARDEDPRELFRKRVGKELARLLEAQYDCPFLANRGAVTCRCTRFAEVVAPRRGEFALRWGNADAINRIVGQALDTAKIEEMLAEKVGSWS
jgi:hypothetical protein